MKKSLHLPFCFAGFSGIVIVNKMIRKIMPILGLIMLASPMFSQVRIYRKLPGDGSIGFGLSSKYNVEVKACDGSFQSVHTYAIVPNDGGRVTQMEHLAMFGFDPTGGPVTIKLTLQNGTNLTSANIGLRNKTYQGVTTSFADGAMYIEVCDPMKQLMVRMPSDIGNPLMIHVDPYHDPAIPAGSNVVVFDGGTNGKIHEQTAQYDRYTVPNNVDVVVVEDGALFKGTVHVESDRTTPLTIQGHGMIICRFVEKPANAVKMRYNAMELNRGIGHRIYGVTIVNARHFAIRTSDSAHIQDIKIYGYRANNDGIKTGANSTIENSFFKCNDDHIKLYANNIEVRNCVFYEQSNGAVFQFGWNNLDPGDNCLIEHIEVIEWEANIGDPTLGQGGIARSFINHREAESTGKAGKNNLFRNIYIQGPVAGLVCLNGYQFQPITHENLTLENVTLEQATTKTSWLYASTGGGTTSIELNLKNVRYGDRFVQQSDFKTLGTVTINIDNTGTKYVGFMNPSEPINCQTCGITRPIPGIIAAESFTNQSGIQTEPTTDTGGGENIGFINNGDWTEYAVSVAQAGTYNLDVRVASSTVGGTINFLADGANVGAVNVPGTGGWQTWTTVSTTVSLSSGMQTLRLVYSGGSGSLFNINWFEFTRSGGGVVFIDHNSSGQRLKANATGGAVGLKAATFTGVNVQWDQVDAGGGFFFLVHQASGNKLHSSDGLAVNTVAPSFTGNNVQWSWIDAGGGWYRLEHKESGNWLHAMPEATDFRLGTNTLTGTNTMWKFTDVGGSGARIAFVDLQEEGSDVEVQLYPNPTGDLLNLTGISSETQATIFDAYGRKVATFTGPSVRVSHLRPGTYLVKVEGWSRTFRLVRR